jgi:cell division protein FtsQ
MDGGGRYLQSLTAGSFGRADGRVFSRKFNLIGSLRIPGAGLFRLSRRSSVAIPLERRIPRFLGTGLALAFFTSVTLTGLSQGGHLDQFYATYGEPHHALARAFGLGLDRITISGIDHVRESEILAAAGLHPLLSLAWLDVGEVRERLEHVPLIKSASVRKLYPSELVITITERVPAALWQSNGEVFVTAADGTPMDLLQDERLVDLPLVVGEGANARLDEYLALIEAAGPLKERIRAGTLVAGRRWTLKIDNGLDVRLPETGVQEAIARLVRLEREQKILEKDVLAVDLRMPDRVVVRLTEEAASARAEMLKKKPMRGKGVDT